jgi:hypothetical protein
VNIYLEEVFMRKNMLGKTLILGLIVLFIGAGIYTAFAVEINSTMINNQSEEDYCCEAKSDYKQVIAERLIAKLKIFINRILLKVSGIPEIEEEFKDILDAFNSDKSICDLVMQINASISPRINDLLDLIPQYTFKYIQSRILMTKLLFLIWIKGDLVILWSWSECGDWP